MVKRLWMIAVISTLGPSAGLWPEASYAATDGGPRVFAPGQISGGAHDAAPAFTRDGRRVYFSRTNGSGSTIVESHRLGDGWSAPKIAPFSGRWSDMEPALAPDGSYLVFISNRPALGEGAPLDGTFNGRSQPGQGGNLWRVDRKGEGWSAPRRLPDTVNTGSTIFAPAVARDGSLYFMRPAATTGRFQLFRAQARGGGFETPEALPFSSGETSDVDPAVDPDERFLVFGSGRPPAPDMDLFIVFRDGTGWGAPLHLGPLVNASGSDAEARLGPDGRTLYFSSERKAPRREPRTLSSVAADLEDMNIWNNGLYNIWSVSLAPWLDAHLAPVSRKGGP